MAVSTMPFASALFDIACEEHKEQAFLDQLREIRDLFDASPEYKAALDHPRITREEKKHWMEELFEGKSDDMIANFMQVLTQYGMASRMDEIYEDYLSLYRKRENIEPVLVESAAALDADQEEKLRRMLEKKLNKKVELQVKVEPALIAGLRIHTADHVLDNTMASRLNSMKEKLNG